MIKSYFEEKSCETIIDYGKGLESLMKRLENWKDQRASKCNSTNICDAGYSCSIVNDISISLGRLAKNISTLSKQVPKSLSLVTETAHMFELRSSINKGKITRIRFNRN